MWALLHRAFTRPVPPSMGRRRGARAPLRCQFQLSNGHVVRLTRRQLVLLTGITAGHGNRRLAATMHLQEKTIKNYVSLLYDELGIREHAGETDALLVRRVQAAVLACSERLVPPYNGQPPANWH